MPLVASLASLVAAMRARVLDRGACGPLADRRVAAAARRELAGHLLAAAPMWRKLWVSSMITKAAAGWSWGLGIKNLSLVRDVQLGHAHQLFSFKNFSLVRDVKGRRNPLKRTRRTDLLTCCGCINAESRAASALTCFVAHAEAARGSGTGPALTGVIDQGRSSKMAC